MLFFSSNHLKDGNNTFRFANTLGSNMVLQRAPLNSKLWGFGEEGQTVQLKLGNTQTFRTTVKKDQNGNSTWSIQLPAMKAGGPYTITAISFIKGFTVTISIENVLFGDVWMCAGQSNMELTVPQAFTGELELAEYADNRPNIRIFTITPKYSLKVPLVDFNQDGITQNWTVASREALTGPAWAYFSAVCWMYGRRLYDQYKIPIGLIQGDWGGTSAEAWSSPDALLKCGLTKTDDSVNLRRPKTKKSDKQSKENKEMDGSEDFLLKQVFKGSHLGESFPDSTMMKFWKRIDEKIHDSKTKLKMKKDIKSFVSKTKGMVSKFLNRVKNAHQNFQKRKGQSKHRIPKQIKPMMVSKDSLNAPGPENNHSALWNGMMAPFTRSTIKVF
uniref:Sialate O-acetylesterase domain-containing protein n=1 Tax=Clytia hemisphaerica TaxID=252671 RepID=A0A7M5WVD5_9CNID